MSTLGITDRHVSSAAATIRAGIGLLLCLAAPTATHGQEPPRGGGLLPRPADGVSREELVQRWDLDSNGKIDESEAEVARTRMRRERAELWRTTGVDPITGQPRSEADELAEEESPRLDPDMDEEPEAPAKPDAAGPTLPGSRVPDVRLPTPTAPAPKPPVPAASRGTGRAAATNPPALRTGREMATGGVRAGAPAARPGYGATGTKNELNAGRRPGTPLRPGGTPQRALPGTSRQPAAPAPPLVPAPRISAEEIGGY